MDQIKSATIYIQATVAALLYNLMHMFAWELPVAIKLGWMINVIGDVFIISISTMSIILIAFRKRIGLILGMMPALWAIFFQWFLVYIISGYKEPYGVWWYPLFPIFQGIMIGYFSFLTYKDKNRHHGSRIERLKGLKSPSIYLYAVSGFLLVQTGQKFVREMVVGFDQSGIRGLVVVIFVTLITIVAAAMILKRMKWGLRLALVSGTILLMQPIVYHLIMGKPCLGGIWWYPIFTAFQGVFIIYFSLLVFLNERKITGQIDS